MEERKEGKRGNGQNEIKNLRNKGMEERNEERKKLK
jgi:hypothetical protein